MIQIDCFDDLNNIKFKFYYIADGTTGSDGTLTIPNITGSKHLYLLRTTYPDNIGSSFGVVNIYSINESIIILRFRTLKDGSANANKHIDMTVLFAYY